MDARRAPHRILSFHAPDQVSGFFRPPRTSHSLPAGSPCPEQAVSGAMPRDYRIGLDEDECFGPVGPDPTTADSLYAAPATRPGLIAQTDSSTWTQWAHSRPVSSQSLD